jgi:oligopeptide/dipeptide ABC transporter ATP-binding protein
VHTIGDQIAEVFELHQGMSHSEAIEQTIAMLTEVGMSLPEQRVRQYPHQLSGGMRQRAMIAMALACNPALLLADEPTTALDVTIQAQILDLMRQLQEVHGTAILMITHNLGVIAEMARRVAVMYMGQIVESGTTRQIFHNPQHPYTIGLLQSVPKLGSSMRVRLVPIPGSVPDPFSIPVGCSFRPRCRAAKRPTCRNEEGIAIVETEPGHLVRCAQYM